MWICFNVEQFRAIVHDNDCMRSLLLTAELFPVRHHVERDNDDLDEALEVLNGIEVESDDVTDVEWFDDAVEELRKELVEWQLGNMEGVATHENDTFQLGLVIEELVEEATEPGYERSVTGVLDGGGQEFKEVVSDVFMKTLLLQNCPCHCWRSHID